MHLFNVLLLFGVILATECVELFFNPQLELNRGHKRCSEDASVSKECYGSCSLEKNNMLTKQAPFGVNFKEFGPYYTKYADACWKSLGTTAKPSCAQGEQFVSCFFNATRNEDEEVIEDCAKKFPVKNITTFDMTLEDVLKNNNWACFCGCVADKTHFFKSPNDDEIDLNSLNPHVHLVFNPIEAAAKCEADYQQEDKCTRRASRWVCLANAFYDARNKITTKN